VRGKSNALGEGAHAGAMTDRPSFQVERKLALFKLETL
jgi:hypothetical protein